MDENENYLQEQITRFKIKARQFLKDNTKAFIVDTKNTYYFCLIDEPLEEAFFWVTNFKGQREGQKEKIYWILFL